MRWRIAATGATTVLAVALVVASAYAWTRDTGADEDPASSAPALAERGRMLFEAKGCTACHYMARQGFSIGTRDFAPNLTPLPAEAGTRVEGMSAEEYVRVSILNPAAYIVPGYSTFQMPQLPVSGDEVDALVAFLLDER